MKHSVYHLYVYYAYDGIFIVAFTPI